MTKKHFKALADAIASMKEHATDNGYVKHKNVISVIGHAVREFNPNFDWPRWDDACNGRPYRK